jgi:hypothetical protein
VVPLALSIGLENKDDTRDFKLAAKNPNNVEAVDTSFVVSDLDLLESTNHCHSSKHDLDASFAPKGCMYIWLLILDSLPPENIGTIEVTPQALRCYAYVYRDSICLDALPQWNTWQLRYFSVDHMDFILFVN